MNDKEISTIRERLGIIHRNAELFKLGKQKTISGMDKLDKIQEQAQKIDELLKDHIAEITALKARIAELEGEKKTRYDWSEAPDWATHAATNEDGTAWWHEKEPDIWDDQMWYDGGFSMAIGDMPNIQPYWRESLEKRPGT